jgi:glycosyltransferase involved in cell wall biosynthesis
MRGFTEFLMPLRVPLVATLCNKYLVKVLPFRWLALTNVLIAREQPKNPAVDVDYSVSVIVPARNEAGNIRRILDETPAIGRGTETIFVEGNSTDGTYEAIERELGSRPAQRCKLLRQPGKGKGDAVRTGFAAATGEVLMILDADATVMPADLQRFYEALRSRKGELINGVRLVYPMEDRAMSFFNLLGNTLFSWAFTWLLGQPVKDTLCGTKVLWRRDYEILAPVVKEAFGDFDPFGDFELLFGAAKLNLKIVDLPVRYRQRTYGTTNIARWKHGAMLLRMFLKGVRRLRFV